MGKEVELYKDVGKKSASERLEAAMSECMDKIDMVEYLMAVAEKSPGMFLKFAEKFIAKQGVASSDEKVKVVLDVRGEVGSDKPDITKLIEAEVVEEEKGV